MFFEATKQALLEFSAAKGQWTAFDASAFKLVGDPAGLIKLVDDAPPRRSQTPDGRCWSVAVTDCIPRVGTLGEAESVLKSRVDTVQGCDVLAFAYSPEKDGAFPDKTAPYPGKEGSGYDCFAVRATGTIRIPSAGTWTFGVHSDDGARVKISGRGFSEVFASPECTKGNCDTMVAPVAIPAAWDYTVEIVHFNSGGPAQLEFSAAKGSWATFDKSVFRLVGDPECEIKMVKGTGGSGVSPLLPAGGTCPGCNGERVKWVRCPKCGGKGQIVKARPVGGGTVKEMFKCPKCSTPSTPARGKGRGKVRGVCPTCNGDGTVKPKSRNRP